MNAKIWKTGIAFCFALVLLWLLSEPPQQHTDNSTKSTGMVVSVIEAKPQEVALDFTATGVTQPHWPTQIIAAVNGRITDLTAQTEPGDLVAADQLLLQILDTAYQAQVQAASARVAQAELELSRNQHEQQVKKQTARGTKLTAFGRLEPHVKASETELLAAQAALKQAQQTRQDTRVKTPFPAVILDKKVTPGQWVNHGDALFTVASSETVDVNVQLSASQWSQAANLAVGSQAELTDSSGLSWLARVRYLSPVMNETTRQRSLMLAVNNPYIGSSPLLPGQQVTVKFTGQQEPNVVVAPASVLTADGHVWSVVDGLLQLDAIDLLQEQADTITFRYQQKPQAERALVLYPLSAMLAGQKVTTKPINWQSEPSS